MQLIVGLGNPGDEFINTRHNVGFEFINKLMKKNEINAKFQHNALTGVINIDSKKIIFAKPQTYMNLSGKSVCEIVRYYKIDLYNIIVVYDDVDVEIGKIKIKCKGSSGGHNGIKSIIQELNSNEFTRIRVGIGPRPKDFCMNNYVLGEFSNEEKIKLDAAFDLAYRACKEIIEHNVYIAMNSFNKKIKQ
jgi:PTH1 family peptidyl-tRNA hydrolase